MAGSRHEAYRDAFGAVRRVVNRLDPVGLIATGAPDDEYDPEVTDLVRLVMRSEAFSESDVAEVWCRWFGDEYGLLPDDPSLRDQTRELHRLQQPYAPPR